jgi:hypothetical protein
MSTSANPYELGSGSREFLYDETPREVVAALCEFNFSGRLFNPLDNPLASEQLRAQREDWRQSGHTVVFTQGVFDLFHINHGALLQYSRLSAVPFHYDTHDAHTSGVSWRDLSPELQQQYREYALSSGLIKQVVSVDGTQHVSARKNGDTSKPGARPTLDWDTRVRDILLASSAVDGITPRFLVDAATMHDKIRPELAGTPHGTITDIASFLDPDVWAIHVDSPQIISALKEDVDGRFNRIQPVILTNRGPYSDRLVGDISTSSIVERAMGASLLAESLVSDSKL